MRVKLITVFLLGIVMGIALTATVRRPGTGGAAGTVRDLTADELGKVTGLIGRRGEQRLCGSLYNGNRDLSVTEVELRIVAFAGPDSTARSYLYGPADSIITPLASREFCIGFLLNPPEDFSWSIVAARGRTTR